MLRKTICFTFSIFVILFHVSDQSLFTIPFAFQKQHFTLSQLDSAFFNPPPPPDIRYTRFDSGIRPTVIEYAGVGMDDTSRKKRKKKYLRVRDINKYISSQRL